MKANVVIEKSFDSGKAFSKEWEQGDFREFFTDEGQYIDNLCDILDGKGKPNEEFTVTYKVTVTK